MASRRKKKKAKVPIVLTLVSRRIARCRADLISLIYTERCRQKGAALLQHTRQRLREQRLGVDRNLGAIVKLQRKKLESEAARAEASRELAAARKDAIERQQIIDQDKTESRKVTPPDAIDGTSNVVEDVRWVYNNLATLIKVNPDTGVRHLNPDVIQDAPSQGAFAFAMYACDNMNAFLERFVVKLFPRDARFSGESSTSEDELDPALGELKEYFEFEGK